jgi:hypothetical protein
MVNQKVAARLQVGPNCLLFFIDETGHETFADKNYPVFGLGGCAINSSSAAAVIAEPWRAMKAAHFGGEDVPLHANELRKPTTEQLDALSKFFHEQQFARRRRMAVAGGNLDEIAAGEGVSTGLAA